jgi:hypothetical protein
MKSAPRHPAPLLFVALALSIVTAPAAQAQDSTVRAGANHADETAAVLAIADAALQAITAGDPVAFTDLMIHEAVMFPSSERDGVAGYSVRTREAQRSAPFGAVIVERGFDAEARVSGTVAMVWLPYDLYVNGSWSHCGADVFIMVRVANDWKIASMAWSVEQPPACRKHPDGPPEGGNR